MTEAGKGQKKSEKDAGRSSHRSHGTILHDGLSAGTMVSVRKNYAAAGVPMILLAAAAIVVLDIRTAFEAPQQLRRTISEIGRAHV